VSQTQATYALLQQFHHHYQRLQQRHRPLLRFADITRRLNSLAELAAPERLTFRLDSRIDHLLLDEFQGYCAAPVARPEAAGRAVDRNRQRWFLLLRRRRETSHLWLAGGEAGIFAAIDGSCRTGFQTLVASYRSAPPIIDTVNQIFTHLADHPTWGAVKRPWTVGARSSSLTVRSART